MKLYKISQDENDGYDTYDSAIVCAESAEIARNINPYNGKQMNSNEWRNWWGWCSSPSSVEVKLIGEAAAGVKEGVVLASFNAG